MTKTSTALLLPVGGIWGSSFLLISVAVEDVSPLQLTFFRCIGGAVILLAFLKLRPQSSVPPKRNLGFPLLIAGLGVLLPFFLIGWAQTEIESGSAAVLNATMPLFTMFFAAIFLAEERLTWRGAAAVVVGIVGVVVLIGNGFEDLTGNDIVAQAAVVAASASYGASAVISRVALRQWDPIPLSATMVAIASVAAGIIVLTTDSPSLDLPADVWISILALGMLGTGFAYIAYYSLIASAGSVRGSFVAFIIPPVGVALGAIVLDETVSWNTFVGGAIILVGVSLGSRGVQLPKIKRTPIHSG